ncbi:MAG: substrate-binding domain-containing protein [Ignavibacterium sp.]
MAKDGLSLYVNPSNVVNDLTLQQVKQIFTGKINNWKDVGGKDAVIIPIL